MFLLNKEHIERNLEDPIIVSPSILQVHQGKGHFQEVRQGKEDLQQYLFHRIKVFYMLQLIMGEQVDKLNC